MTITGTLVVSSTITATNFYISSDQRLKHDIAPLFVAKGLAIVDALRPVSFSWNKDDKADVGVIAQEVEAIFPSAVTTKDDGFKAVAYDKLVLPVIEAVKELHAMVLSEHASMVTLLEWNTRADARLETIERDNAALKAVNDNLMHDNASLHRELLEIRKDMEQGRTPYDKRSDNVIRLKLAA